MGRKKPADDKPHGYLVGYARVSTGEQNLDLQIQALKKAGVKPDNLHVEKIGATAKNRTELNYAIMDCRDGDTFIVWRLDRLARSMPELYKLLDRIYANGAKFRSITENFDFDTISGKFVLAILGAVAEFERNIISQRTQAGIAALRERRKGKKWKWGRKLVMTKEMIAKAGDMLNGRNGKPKMKGPAVAKKLGVSTASIYAHWKQAPGGKFIPKRRKAA